MKMALHRIQLRGYENADASCKQLLHAPDAVLEVLPITLAIGAGIHGVRLCGNLPDETVNAIRNRV